MNVKERLKQIIRCGEKRAVPLCFYPARKLIGASMEQILSDSEAGANCLLAIREKFHPSMLVRMTELWVEAEAFGAEVEISENDFPSIKGAAVEDISDVSSLNMPSANHGRLEVFVDMMQKAKSAMPNELLFAGVTGPFSLCGCLSDAQELMMSCYAAVSYTHLDVYKRQEVSRLRIRRMAPNKTINSRCFCSPTMRSSVSGNFSISSSILSA